MLSLPKVVDLRSLTLTMMRTPFFEWLFRRNPFARAVEPTDYQTLQSSPASLESEYQKLIAYHLQRWGVSEKHAVVTVRQVGQDRRDRVLLVAVIQLHRWERNVALRMMLGLPLFERKIRKVLQGTWMADVSRFEGLWLHASDELQGNAATTDLRHLLVTLTGHRHAGSMGSDDRDDSHP